MLPVHTTVCAALKYPADTVPEAVMLFVVVIVLKLLVPPVAFTVDP